MFELDFEDLGGDASQVFDEQKEKVSQLFRVSFQEVEIEVTSIRELTARLMKYLPHVIDACNEGYDSPLEVLMVIRRLKAKIEFEEKSLLPLALLEAQKYSENELKEAFGFSIGVIADTLDYEQDEQYKELKRLLDARRGKLKAAVKSGKEFFDEDTGEMLPRVDVKKYGGETLKRIKK